MGTPAESLPPTISVKRAGELLGVSLRSAYRAASRGQIPTVRVGRRLLVPTQRLLDLLGMHPTNDAPVKVSRRFVVDASSPPVGEDAGRDVDPSDGQVSTDS